MIFGNPSIDSDHKSFSKSKLTKLEIERAFTLFLKVNVGSKFLAPISHGPFKICFLSLQNSFNVSVFPTRLLPYNTINSDFFELNLSFKNCNSFSLPINVFILHNYNRDLYNLDYINILYPISIKYSI